MQKSFSVSTETEMQELGRRLGEVAVPGDLIALVGDLGAGKTTLTKGIAKGLGVTAEITSPTFQLVKEYHGRTPLFHLDLYRMGKVGELDHLEPEEMLENGVLVVEWGEFLLDRLGEAYLEVIIAMEEDLETRSVTLIPHGKKYEQLVMGL